MSEKRSITQFTKNVNLSYESISSCQEPVVDPNVSSVASGSAERTVLVRIESNVIGGGLAIIRRKVSSGVYGQCELATEL